VVRADQELRTVASGEGVERLLAEGEAVQVERLAAAEEGASIEGGGAGGTWSSPVMRCRSLGRGKASGYLYVLCIDFLYADC